MSGREKQSLLPDQAPQRKGCRLEAWRRVYRGGWRRNIGNLEVIARQRKPLENLEPRPLLLLLAFPGKKEALASVCCLSC